jgi:outer membrane murein-binding lipoprotein Lpp
MKSFSPATILAIATFTGALVSGSIVQRAPESAEMESVSQITQELSNAIDMLESNLAMRLSMDAPQENANTKRQAPQVGGANPLLGSLQQAQSQIASQSSSIRKLSLV